MQVQPPLQEAMKAYFNLPDEKLPVQWFMSVPDNLIIFPLQNMQKANYEAGEDARISLAKSGWFEIYDQSGKCKSKARRL